MSVTLRDSLRPLATDILFSHPLDRPRHAMTIVAASATLALLCIPAVQRRPTHAPDAAGRSLPDATRSEEESRAACPHGARTSGRPRSGRVGHTSEHGGARRQADGRSGLLRAPEQASGRKPSTEACAVTGRYDARRGLCGCGGGSRWSPSPSPSPSRSRGRKCLGSVRRAGPPGNRTDGSGAGRAEGGTGRAGLDRGGVVRPAGGQRGPGNRCTVAVACVGRGHGPGVRVEAVLARPPRRPRRTAHRGPSQDAHDHGDCRGAEGHPAVGGPSASRR